MTPELIDYVRRVGPEYGTEDSSIYLYSMIKMQRPQMVLELGTGLGTCTFPMAQGVKENGEGHVWTVDDGSQWPEKRKHPHVRERTRGKPQPYGAYIRDLAGAFGVDRHMTLIEDRMPPYPDPDGPVDLLFCDFRHDLVGVMAILGAYLPRMSGASSIYIDSASTFYPSYLLLERLVDMFRRNQVPEQLLHVAGEENAGKILNLVPRRRFTLVHLTERKTREQNSMCWLKIEPHDVIPHPRTELHG
ncbi:MAG: class I SAM-dependent methyltransferase [Alphaproteobacteria bacterium]